VAGERQRQRRRSARARESKRLDDGCKTMFSGGPFCSRGLEVVDEFLVQVFDAN
jgi:hypothetical protein